MELFNNNRALSNSLDETEKENYNHFAILLNLVGKLLSEGCTISKLYNLYDVHLIDEGGKFPAKSILKRNIDRISKYFREDIPKSAEEIEICNILDKVIMSEDTKKKVREECNITLPHFQVIMGKLRKNKVIIDGKINPRFIPNIDEETGTFQLLLLFELK